MPCNPFVSFENHFIKFLSHCHPVTLYRLISIVITNLTFDTVGHLLSLYLMLQGSVVGENSDDNVHILDQTLFLSSVSRENSGDYVCTVTNQAGSSSSNTVKISVPGEMIPHWVRTHFGSAVPPLSK